MIDLSKYEELRDKLRVGSPTLDKVSKAIEETEIAKMKEALEKAEEEVEHYAKLALVDIGGYPPVSWKERAEAAEAEVAKLRADNPMKKALDYIVFVARSITWPGG